MKILMSFFIFVVFNLMAYSSDSIINSKKIVEKNGLYYERANNMLFTGISEERFSNNKIRKRTTFRKGKKNGVETEWNENNYKTTKIWMDGVLSGDLMVYSNNDNVIQIICYENDKPNIEETIKKNKELRKSNIKKYGLVNIDVARTCNRLGDLLGGWDNDNDALSYFKEALKIIDNLGLGDDNIDIAHSYAGIGVIYSKIGKFELSIKNQLKALKIRENLLGINSIETSKSYQHLADLYKKKNDFKNAIKFYDKAISINTVKISEENYSLALRNLVYLSDTYGQINNLEKEIECLDRSIKLLEKYNKNHFYLPIALHDCGIKYMEIGKYSISLAYLNRAINIIKGTGNGYESKLPTYYHSIGEVYRNIGNLKDADTFLNKSLNLKEKFFGKESVDLAITYEALGVLSIDKGDYIKAKDYFSQAVKLNQIHGNIIGKYSALFGIGNCFLHDLDFENAIKIYFEILEFEIEKKGKNSLDVADVYYNLGVAYRKMGDIENAIRYYKEASVIFENIYKKDHNKIGKLYNNLGYLYLNLNQSEEALKYLSLSEDILVNNLGENHFELATLYNNLGGLYISGPHENLDKALLYLDKSLNIRKENFNDNNFWLARNYGYYCKLNIKLGNLNDAILYANKSLSILNKKLESKHPEIAEKHNLMGYINYEQDKIDQALIAERTAHKIRSKQLSEILSFANENERLAYYLQLQNEIFNPFSLFGTLGSAVDLLEASLDYKGIVLSSILEDRKTQAKHSDNNKFAEKKLQLLKLSRKLNSLQNKIVNSNNDNFIEESSNKINETKDRIRETQRNITREFNNFGGVRESLKINLNDLKQNLSSADVFVDYILYRHYTGKLSWEMRFGAVVVQQKQDLLWFNLGKFDDIANTIKILNSHSDVDNDTYEKTLLYAYNKLMQPIVEKLSKDVNTLIISPDSRLNFLSFATLLTTEGKFLCENYTIKYVSSGRDLVPNNKSLQSKKQLLIFANPNYEEDPILFADTTDNGIVLRAGYQNDLSRSLRFVRLPGTQKEADYLKSKSKDWGLKPDVFSGIAASELALSNVDSPYILHLATHGFILSERPNDNKSKSIPILNNPMYRSGLALAGAQNTLDAWTIGVVPSTENDGILTAAEASLLDLEGTWLVVLSACETGLGEARSGEGVLGLRRAFIQAGAENLLMTLWPVSDKYTIPLMKDFYDNAIDSGDAPSALAEVQRQRLLKMREAVGTRLAVQLYGPFIMNFHRVK